MPVPLVGAQKPPCLCKMQNYKLGDVDLSIRCVLLSKQPADNALLLVQERCGRMHMLGGELASERGV